MEERKIEEVKFIKNNNKKKLCMIIKYNNNNEYIKELNETDKKELFLTLMNIYMRR